MELHEGGDALDVGRCHEVGLVRGGTACSLLKHPSAFIWSSTHPDIAECRTSLPRLHFDLSFHPNTGGGSDSETGLNSSVNVCADEYVGADKEKETKPDVLFLRAPVASGC